MAYGMPGEEAWNRSHDRPSPFEADAVILRIADGEGLYSPAELLGQELYERGIPFLVSPAARQRSRSKAVTHQLWEWAGISQPRWRVIHSPWKMGDRKQIESIFPGPVLTKPIHGAKGQGIEYFGSGEAAGRRGDEYPLLLQEYIEPRYVWRTIADESRLITAYRKAVLSGSFIAAVSLGSEREYAEPHAQLEALSTAMVRALGGGIYGCDLLEDHQGRLYALELNMTFGFPPEEAPAIARATSDWLEKRLADKDDSDERDNGNQNGQAKDDAPEDRDNPGGG